MTSTKPTSLKLFLVTALILALLPHCASLSLGRPFAVNPSEALKVGHDTKKDVLQKMGAPYRQLTDPRGREIFTYVWTDGEGAGQKCTVAFNKNGLVTFVEVSP